jgi:hypothetical protein
VVAFFKHVACIRRDYVAYIQRGLSEWFACPLKPYHQSAPQRPPVQSVTYVGKECPGLKLTFSVRLLTCQINYLVRMKEL